jgi:hypothetical protein
VTHPATTRLLGGLIVLILSGAAAPAQTGQAAAKHGWHTDYDAARAEARRTGKPIFLVFRCEP